MENFKGILDSILLINVLIGSLINMSTQSLIERTCEIL